MSDKDLNVLILSRGFRAGDAITTINLFSQWPKERLFCASPVESEYSERVGEFYFLGDKEVSYSFPFNHLGRPAPSHIGSNCGKSVRSVSPRSSFKRLYEKFGRPLLQYLDRYESRLSLTVSDDFARWIEHISPDVIYTSIGDIAMARFILKLHGLYPQIKILVHGFDDWLSPTYRIINGRRHRRRAESLFREILDIASGYFTSSEKMAGEYSRLYGHDFKCFPNPVRIVANEGTITKNKVANVVFTGKVGWHNDTALRQMIDVVNRLNIDGDETVRFDIYTDTEPDQIALFLGEIPATTVIHPPVPNSEIPAILASAHVLYLPISIDSQTRKFTRYSMSTKMGEYLSSGTPMIYYGPKGIAMTEFLQRHDCADVITENDPMLLNAAVILAIDFPDSKKLLQAKDLADRYFNIDKVSAGFCNSIKLIGKNS